MTPNLLPVTIRTARPVWEMAAFLISYSRGMELVTPLSVIPVAAMKAMLVLKLLRKAAESEPVRECVERCSSPGSMIRRMLG